MDVGLLRQLVGQHLVLLRLEVGVDGLLLDVELRRHLVGLHGALAVQRGALPQVDLLLDVGLLRHLVGLHLVLLLLEVGGLDGLLLDVELLRHLVGLHGALVVQ